MDIVACNNVVFSSVYINPILHFGVFTEDPVAKRSGLLLANGLADVVECLIARIASLSARFPALPCYVPSYLVTSQCIPEKKIAMVPVPGDSYPRVRLM